MRHLLILFLSLAHNCVMSHSVRFLLSTKTKIVRVGYTQIMSTARGQVNSHLYGLYYYCTTVLLLSSGLLGVLGRLDQNLSVGLRQFERQQHYSIGVYTHSVCANLRNNACASRWPMTFWAESVITPHCNNRAMVMSSNANTEPHKQIRP